MRSAGWNRWSKSVCALNRRAPTTLAKRLNKLEQQHDELKKVAIEVEGRLERAMEYIRSLLAADQQ